MHAPGGLPERGLPLAEWNVFAVRPWGSFPQAHLHGGQDGLDPGRVVQRFQPEGAAHEEARVRVRAALRHRRPRARRELDAVSLGLLCMRGR